MRMENLRYRFVCRKVTLIKITIRYIIVIPLRPLLPMWQVKHNLLRTWFRQETVRWFCRWNCKIRLARINPSKQYLKYRTWMDNLWRWRGIITCTLPKTRTLSSWKRNRLQREPLLLMKTWRSTGRIFHRDLMCWKHQWKTIRARKWLLTPTRFFSLSRTNVRP